MMDVIFTSTITNMNNILARSKNPDRIANSYVLDAGARGFLSFGESGG